jgi:monofunctional biosynthetic peptidoglycan transglycosylase
MNKEKLKSYLTLRNILYTLAGIFIVSSLWFYFSLPDVSYLKNENPKFTALMELRKEQAADANKKFRIKQTWVSFRNIPSMLKKSVRITEDASFYKHNGIDLVEFWESVKKNLAEGEFARGGSTITQQLAKNLYLSTEKSLFRKFRELFIAYRLEDALNKNRIYHLYLNVIEFGPGVFGVQAGARYYFNKNVQDLTLGEIVRLTAIIPRPLKINAAGKSRWLKWKCRWILGKMKLYKYISEDTYNSAIIEFK